MPSTSGSAWLGHGIRTRRAKAAAAQGLRPQAMFTIVPGSRRVSQVRKEVLESLAERSLWLASFCVGFCPGVICGRLDFLEGSPLRHGLCAFD